MGEGQLRPPGIKNPAILIVDDSPDVVVGLAAILRQKHSTVLVANSATDALAIISERAIDLMISDISMPDMDGLALLSLVRERSPETLVIMITGYGSVESAVEAMKLGAYHYVAKPFRPEEILMQVDRGLQRLCLEREVADLRRRVANPGAFGGIIAQSKKMLDVFDFIRNVAPTDAPVMIRGESGTGKELVARAVHRESGRSGRQFLGINTAALPEALLEAELFGYRKGAFTGAASDKEGLLTAARGGTVFLDEISRMPPSSQAKLLRAIEEMEVLPVGGLDPVQVDVRFVSATNSEELADIRQDLFYRLSVMEIRIPPLRERIEDVPLLATHFVAVYAGKFSRGAKRLTPDALDVLMRHRWPGNVRELENVIQRAVVVSPGEEIGARDILMTSGAAGETEGAGACVSLPYERARNEALASFQRGYVRELLTAAGGNISRAAAAGGITRGALYGIMKKIGMKKGGAVRQRV